MNIQVDRIHTFKFQNSQVRGNLLDFNKHSLVWNDE